jgi:hypothetical protein
VDPTAIVETRSQLGSQPSSDSGLRSELNL